MRTSDRTNFLLFMNTSIAAVFSSEQLQRLSLVKQLPTYLPTYLPSYVRTYLQPLWALAAFSVS
jgi:hypothetical protein